MSGVRVEETKLVHIPVIIIEIRLTQYRTALNLKNTSLHRRSYLLFLRHVIFQVRGQRDCLAKKVGKEFKILSTRSDLKIPSLLTLNLTR